MDLGSLTPRSVARETKDYLASVLPTLNDCLSRMTMDRPLDPFAYVGRELCKYSSNEAVRRIAATLDIKTYRWEDMLEEKNRQEEVDISGDLKHDSKEVREKVNAILSAGKNKKLVNKLFTMMDENKNGKLEVSEIKSIVELYEGRKYHFNEDSFLEWYDTKSDHSLDKYEFAQFIADLAWAYARPSVEEAGEVLPLIVAQFKDMHALHVKQKEARAKASAFELSPLPDRERTGKLFNCGADKSLVLIEAKGEIYKLVTTPEGDSWQEQPGQARWIDIGEDGEIWMIEKIGGELQRWDNTAYGWVKVERGSSMTHTPAQIAIGSSKHVLCMDVKGNVYQYASRAWHELPSTAKHISIGNDGTIWAVLSDDRVATYLASGWVPSNTSNAGVGVVIAVACGSETEVYLLNEKGQVFKKDTNVDDDKWDRVGNKEGFTYIGAAWDGTVTAVDPDLNLYINTI